MICVCMCVCMCLFLPLPLDNKFFKGSERIFLISQPLDPTQELKHGKYSVALYGMNEWINQYSDGMLT